MLETDQILVIGQVTGNMGVPESDVAIFPSHAADGLGGLGNDQKLL